MPRRFRDAAGTTAVLLVLFGMLIAINPTVRERVTQFAGGNADHWFVPGRIVSDVMVSTSATAFSYAADNSYMVFFLIVAGLLFILMLRT
jgi:hypothetical protein